MTKTPRNDQPRSEDRGDGRAGKYLAFALAGEQYAMSLDAVREIIGSAVLASRPNMPESVRGLIHHRGKTVPVVDPRPGLGLPAARRELYCLIIVEAGGAEFGVAVDRITDVLDLTAGDINAPPLFGVKANTRLVLGVSRSGDRPTILLDIAEIVSKDDLEKVAEDAFAA